MPHTVYLDNAATTPLDPRVLEAMLPHLGGTRGNPSSLHGPGAGAAEAVEQARESVADLIGASPEEILFTSGGTEADNLAVFGLAEAGEKQHAVISTVEHAAVREAVSGMQKRGHELGRIGVDGSGLVDTQEFIRSLNPGTSFAAVVWANNEVGTVQPVKELAEACTERGVLFHTDAVQAAGRTEIDVSEVPVSTLAISAHKLYGPQGVGALYVRDGVDLAPMLYGGGQERGLRSGTENVAGIVGFGEAARLANDELKERIRHEEELRGKIISTALNIDGVRLNGHPEKRLSNNVHLAVEGVEAESLVLLCDAMGYAIGSGSACASGGHKASHTLLAMGQEEAEAFSAVRITVGKDNDLEEVEGFLETFAGAVRQLREISPLYTNT